MRRSREDGVVLTILRAAALARRLRCVGFSGFASSSTAFLEFFAVRSRRALKLAPPTRIMNETRRRLTAFSRQIGRYFALINIIGRSGVRSRRSNRRFVVAAATFDWAQPFKTEELK